MTFPYRRAALGGASVVVLAVAGLLGYRVFGPQDGGSSRASAPTSAPAAARSADPAPPPRSAVAGSRGPVALLPPLSAGPTGPEHAVLPSRPPAGVPVHLDVPAIGISTGLQRLHLLRDGSLEPPTRWGEAGWYAGGVRPGDDGPAVIAGHVDSTAGPAVFFRLRDLRPGALVTVRERGGSELRFRVDRSRSYPKDRFPSHAVYGPTALPELRLVTCTGEFDYAHHNYLDNLVVFAHLVGRAVR
jgi:hypothetical protein